MEFILLALLGKNIFETIRERREYEHAQKAYEQHNELVDNNCRKAMQANDKIRYIVEYSKDGEVFSIKASDSILANIFDDYSVEVISVKGC